MDKGWVVVLGAGVEQEAIYLEAESMGFFTVGFDQNLTAPARNYATRFFPISTTEHQEIIKTLKINMIQPSGVITLGSDVTVSVSKIQKEYNLPGLPINVAYNLTNKLLMKQAFLKASVCSPSFRAVQENSISPESLISLGDKVIVKPIDGRGARGVQLVNTRQSHYVIEAVSLALQASKESQVIIEEFIEGPQFSVEGIVLDSKFHNLVTSERNYSRIGQFGMHVIEDGGQINAKENLDMKNEIEDLMSRAANSLGVQNGTIKGDLVRAPDGRLMVIEIAGRLSGGWLASHQIPVARGIPLLKLALLISTGHSITSSDLKGNANKALAVRYWFPKSGIIKSISGTKDLEKLQGLVKFGFFRNVGQFQPEVSSHADRFGFVIFQGNTAQEAVERCLVGLSSVRIEIEKPV